MVKQFLFMKMFSFYFNLVIKNSISNLWSHGIDYIISNQYENTEKFERKEPLTREIALERYSSFTFSSQLTNVFFLFRYKQLILCSPENILFDIFYEIYRSKNDSLLSRGGLGADPDPTLCTSLLRSGP